MSKTQQIKSQSLVFLPKVAFLYPTQNSGTDPIEVFETCSIGRLDSNTIELADPFVSSHHARIIREEEGFIIRDLKSRNGTFVNGAKITEATLSPGDQIKIGEREFRFELKRVEETNPMGLSSKNPAWDRTLKSLPTFSKTDLPVLLSGESGSGKEVLARAIHSASGRKDFPFVSVNCSALSETLIESELFGHLRGSFTGATSDRKGAFEFARGGTLFLDEIGDLPVHLQPKLLRALENREIRPVGSDKNVSTDIRIISATHRNLAQMVQSGKFRSDLYFRLNVIKLTIPPLRMRAEDFENLLFGFAREMRVKIKQDAVNELKKYTWPGNIRELRNMVSRASALIGDKEVEVDDICNLVDPTYTPGITANLSMKGNGSSIIKQLERQAIVEKLIEFQGNQRRTAEALGMPKSTLHDRIKYHAINIDAILDSTEV